MTFDELSQLAETPGVEIGVHTISRPVLPLPGDADVRTEIQMAHEAIDVTPNVQPPTPKNLAALRVGSWRLAV